MHFRWSLPLTVALAAAFAPVGAQSLSNISYVNGIAIPGNAQDLAGSTSSFNRLGFFSDLYYDRNRNEWWAVSDRGPGGGVISYDTRMQRFTIDINGTTGAISNFQVQQTVLFKSAGVPLNGLAPTAPNTSTLGDSFDPEGLVVVPQTGNFLVSDEYGPSVLEFDRDGNLLRRFTAPANLVPQVGAVTDYASTPPTLTSGREPNRGYEGLAISPDGKYAYAMLQNGTVADGWTAAGRGKYTRIVKYEIATGEAVAQYAYELAGTTQGRGISSIVALGDDRFLVLERNNRGIGPGATLASADKNIFEIDLSAATDVTDINLPTTGALPLGYSAAAKSGKVIDLDANTLAAIGNKVPEKMEGFAVGPMLADGSFMLLMGTDNDYSVTQNGAGTQFDVYFRFSDTDPYASSIQCPIGAVTGCFLTSNNSTAANLTGEYALLPGVLQSYKANINGYVPTVVPEPSTVVLMTIGLGLLGGVVVRRRTARG
ncbi:esterase-like activity of phytase family protein [Gemmatimonas sp.]|uniref:esterase-like activity of phytase family protein n=1 Tax=Gemmatimonas sp. TaxID=1962908 RepID=UPI00286D92C9|nr:esterase-like activity of phytase family protein [Gemmatimonas sp.]